MSEENFVPYEGYVERSGKELKERAQAFYKEVSRRRTVRHFSDRPVPRAVIKDCIQAAATAPNGANMQPWHFAVVEDQDIKKEIRLAAEKEEQEFYERRATNEWLEALRPLGTDPDKPFLEQAPYLIAIFEKRYGLTEEGEKTKYYYVKESVGIATGILITAIHHAGLVSLTHTPSPMGFLNEILDRPKNERPFLLLVVGYPQEGVKVPDISKKSLDEITTFI
ncbi:MAG: nitroreductase family protein [Balneolaceae bacterium]|nr:nitroreductase family protein [Balneolaceae bacterium]